MSEVLQSLQERVRAAAAARTPLRIRSGGTKDFYGNASEGELLDPRAWTGIVDYEPTELVATVRCGTRLADLESALAGRDQMLAFEPPHFGPEATVGGAIAAGLAGPRRGAAGSLRDFILGARLLDGRANVLTFGGQVMKNVAGYDVSRALAGSLGTLGVILDVSLKVLPRPVAEQTLKLEVSEADAIRRTNEWNGQPLPISATAWSNGELFIRLSGAAAGVRAAREKIGGVVESDARGAALWNELREQTHPFFLTSPGSTLWRLSVPPTTPPLDVGPTLIEWRGGQRWIVSTASADTVRAAASAAGGHATAFRGGERRSVFHPLPPALAEIQRRLKTEFDPAGVFNGGRLSPGF
ncbi:MAG: glycolate oxidase subunit GlcE [Burkholderiaceae bacterium]